MRSRVSTSYLTGRSRPPVQSTQWQETRPTTMAYFLVCRIKYCNSHHLSCYSKSLHSTLTHRHQDMMHCHRILDPLGSPRHRWNNLLLDYKHNNHKCVVGSNQSGRTCQFAKQGRFHRFKSRLALFERRFPLLLIDESSAHGVFDKHTFFRTQDKTSIPRTHFTIAGR